MADGAEHRRILRRDLMAGYAEGGGIPPDEATQRWWELYGTVRWALLCRRQAARYLSDSEPSIELAVLGRRVCEQEYDVLLALGHAAPLQVADPLEDTVGPATAPHDRPTGPGLLRAVREFLVTEVAGTDPALAFHARVAANALRIAEREAMLAPGHARDHRARLAALGCADDAELCAAIRDGSLDHRAGDVIAAVRVAPSCIDRSVAYAKTRAPFGQPLASNQAIQFPLAELQTQCEMLRALIHKTAWGMDQSGPLSQSNKVSMCNFVANRLCCDAADRAMQVHGGLGYSRHRPSSTSTVTPAGTASPRALRKSSCGGWRATCSAT